jgi:hypothetical protein
VYDFSQRAECVLDFRCESERGPLVREIEERDDVREIEERDEKQFEIESVTVTF